MWASLFHVFRESGKGVTSSEAPYLVFSKHLHAGHQVSPAPPLMVKGLQVTPHFLETFSLAFSVSIDKLLF